MELKIGTTSEKTQKLTNIPEKRTISKGIFSSNHQIWGDVLVSSGVMGIDRTSRLGFSIVVPSDVQNNGLTLAAVPFQLHCVTIIQSLFTVCSWMTTAEWQWPHALLPKTWGYQEKHPWDPNFAWDPLTASKTRSTKPVKVVQCCHNLELWQQDWRSQIGKVHGVSVVEHPIHSSHSSKF